VSQNDRLLEYLETGKSINPLESWNKLGIYRLAARVKDLKDRGYVIYSDKTEVKNRFGENCKVAEYRLCIN